MKDLNPDTLPATDEEWSDSLCDDYIEEQLKLEAHPDPLVECTDPHQYIHIDKYKENLLEKLRELECNYIDCKAKGPGHTYSEGYFEGAVIAIREIKRLLEPSRLAPMFQNILDDFVKFQGAIDDLKKGDK